VARLLLVAIGKWIAPGKERLAIMSSVNAHFSLNGANVHSIADSGIESFSLQDEPDDLFQQIMEGQMTMLRDKYSTMPSTSSNPTYKSYADVVVGGTVIAKIDNHGFVQSDNGYGGKINRLLEDGEENAGSKSGPELARARAEKIAAAFGGRVVPASTAMSQSAFDAVAQPTVKVDTERLARDPQYLALQAVAAVRPEFYAQLFGQDETAN
jgi:hypothetical protein